MQYVRSLSGQVSKTWNSINPATLSGAIDVIVIEQDDGSLACSPFHVRFGKFSLLRPYEKKVEFRVNNVKQNYSMKLGEGGEAFFVFETTENIPEALQTSPLISPASSPSDTVTDQAATPLIEPTYLDITENGGAKTGPTPTGSPGKPGTPSPNGEPILASRQPSPYGVASDDLSLNLSATSLPGSRLLPPITLERSASEEVLSVGPKEDFERFRRENTMSISDLDINGALKPPSPPSLRPKQALDRAMTLSKKLSSSNIRSKVTESGDLMLDMTGYKSSEDDALRAEVIARKILSEEIEGNYDIGSLIGTDENGNLWIYSSEEAKEAANRKAGAHATTAMAPTINDTASDPGYHSDSDQSSTEVSKTLQGSHTGAPLAPTATHGDSNRNFAKTLRLTSDQLKELKLKPGANPMSFTVNRATCQAYMYYWTCDVPIVISDIDGTITKSDALGHVLNMIGRDWTHIGVAKLYTDIVANGYNIFYLTSRSIGQADTTRAYLNGVVQEGYKLPKGPVIMSPDRTVAALRREVYLRKPEVFKMACLRDILSLFPGKVNPFYAGFGNRLTDALSYRTVNIPSTRIFTINSNAEVSLDLLSLNKYKISYVSMREIVDHFFPPVSMLVKDGGEDFTDFTYWRDTPKGLDDFSATESESSSIAGDDEDEASALEESVNDLAESYLSRESIDQSVLSDSIRDSMEAPMRVASEDLDGDLASDYLGDANIVELAPASAIDEVTSSRDNRKQRGRSKT
jgi:phosphatidate phosphatase LPIN